MAKKKKKKITAKQVESLANFQDEELLALSAIYGEESCCLDTDNHGFVLKVVPHPGEAAANFVSVKLAVR